MAVYVPETARLRRLTDHHALLRLKYEHAAFGRTRGIETPTTRPHALPENDAMGQPTLREAAHSLYESFVAGRGAGVHPYIQSIGEAADTGTIHVYLIREPTAHERPIPETWEGWPVETQVVGRTSLGGQ